MCDLKQLGLLLAAAAALLTRPAPAEAQTYQVLLGFKSVQGPYAGLVQGTDGAFYGTTGGGGASGNGSVFKVSADGSSFALLHSFDVTSGANPRAGLVQGTDGAFYGTTFFGGASGNGAVFKVSADGSAFSLIHSFDFTNGANPEAGLVQGTDGAFYGTTYSGGAFFGGGTVFKISADGSSFSVLHSFDSTNGSQPRAGLVQGTGGAFYGTTYRGGASGRGTVFKVSADGSSFSVLHSFDSTNGANPKASLVQGADGAFYGTTTSGGASDSGTVFKVSADGSSFSLLHDFAGGPADGSQPQAALVLGTDGAFYGTTYSGGGSNDNGIAFKISTDGSSFSLLHNFTAGFGSNPIGLVQGTDGAFYGTTIYGGALDEGTVFKVSDDGSSFSVVHTFGPTTAANPFAGLVEGTDGAFYGTTFSGGTSGSGTVFKVSADGTTSSVVHNFGGGPAGGRPSAGLVQGTDGAFYGTTSSGNVFKVSADGSSFSLIHTFTGGTADGSQPQAGLVQGTDGAFYGTTYRGGTSDNGTVFKVSADGSSFSVLHSFDYTNGGNPEAGLVEGTDGDFYGTAGGGASDQGTVFKVSADGASFSLLHTFAGGTADGSQPQAELVQGTDGAFYGTTRGGGASGNGTVFKVSADGSSFSLLHSFAGSADGSQPQAGLVQGTSGAFYGTTSGGGAFTSGAVFKVSADGSSFSLLHSFARGPADGLAHQAGLVQGADGAFYGTTGTGGPFSGGVVFRLDANGAPTANDQSVSTDQGSPVPITLTATDPDNDVMSYSVVSGPSHGSLTGSAPILTYTPSAAFAGPDSFKFKATDSHGATSNVATVSITVRPQVSINDRRVREGNAGTRYAVFLVRLSGPSAQAVTVTYQTADGTATAGSDYTAISSGTLSFSPNSRSRFIAVPILGDATPEGNETFFVNLSNPANATIVRSQGRGTIVNDDR
jgi:uncharacterized repeat protein (TIGR03803 family)